MVDVLYELVVLMFVAVVTLQLVSIITLYVYVYIIAQPM